MEHLSFLWFVSLTKRREMIHFVRKQALESSAPVFMLRGAMPQEAWHDGLRGKHDRPRFYGLEDEQGYLKKLPEVLTASPEHVKK